MALQDFDPRRFLEKQVKVVGPLVNLYKDDVRNIARYLTIPKEISERHPPPWTPDY